MIGDTLTLENLTPIYEAMSKIKEIDRSNYFNQYFKEVENRIKEVENRIKEEKLLQGINKLLYGLKKVNEDPNITDEDKDKDY